MKRRFSKDHDRFQSSIQSYRRRQRQEWIRSTVFWWHFKWHGIRSWYGNGYDLIWCMLWQWRSCWRFESAILRIVYSLLYSIFYLKTKYIQMDCDIYLSYFLLIALQMIFFYSLCILTSHILEIKSILKSRWRCENNLRSNLYHSNLNDMRFHFWFPENDKMQFLFLILFWNP